MEGAPPDAFGIVGTTVGAAYEVQSVVAEGGFAVVYRARHRGFSAPVALKCLKLSQKLSAERQARFLEQFRAEAELLFQLSSGIPSVVRPLHVDALTAQDGSFVPFLVLEWLQGETLDAYLERRRTEGRAPLGLKRLVRLLTPVARALERAHNFRRPEGTVSIVHLDLKPANIFVAEVGGEEVVKILDFGVARAESVATQIAGQTGDSAGSGSFTPAYAAPEQWLPKRYGRTGPWTDVWGLALTLIEALKGGPALEGDVQGMMTSALDKQRRPTPRHHGIEVSDTVEAVFERALALDPRERQADVGVFWDELLVALGLKIDDRHRDLRSEAGEVPREERIEAALGGRTAVAVQRAVLARRDPDSSVKLAVARRVDPDSSSSVPALQLDEPESGTIELAEPSRAVVIELAARAAPDERRVRSGPHAAAVPFSASRQSPEPALWPRLGAGAALIVVAIVLTLLDRRWEGSLRFGPVNATVIAAALVITGIALIIHRLLPKDRA